MERENAARLFGLKLDFGCSFSVLSCRIISHFNVPDLHLDVLTLFLIALAGTCHEFLVKFEHTATL